MTTRTEINLLFAMLRDIIGKQEVIMTKLYEIEEKTEKNRNVFKETEDMFKACHMGFLQVKEACTCLREELSEHAGNMIVESD